MADKPIIFSGPMVRALLEGRKTQTRRVIKKPAALNALAVFDREFLTLPGNADLIGYAHGDRLWVRETARAVELEDVFDRVIEYRADGAVSEAVASDADTVSPEFGRWWDMMAYRADDPDLNGSKWVPPIHMPRWASRLTLIVESVKVERLQDMEGEHPSESSAIAEGIRAIHHGDGEYFYSAFRDEPHPKNWVYPTDAFCELWKSINGPGSWDANPWVCAIAFRVIRANIDQVPA